MQLLARTERWLMVQRDRNRERIETLESQYKDAVRQRDAARRKVERLRRKLDDKRERMSELRRSCARSAPVRGRGFGKRSGVFRG